MEGGRNRASVASTVEATEATTSFLWEVVGLQKSDYMPVEFDGKVYNLANITEWEAKYLLGQGPEKMPFLRQL